MSQIAILTAHTQEEARLGPAMQALPTEKMRAFVYAMLDSGGSNQTACYQAAYGYTGQSEQWHRVNAHQLAHDERIQAAMFEEAQRRLKSGAILAVSELLKIAANGENKDKTKAIGMILDRVGMHAQTEHKLVIDRPQDEKDMMRELLAIAKKNNLDPRVLLASQGLTLDGEFEDVTPAPDAPEEIDWANMTGEDHDGE